MKIGINGRSLIKPYTGVAMVTKYLVREMAKAYPKVEFLLVCTIDLKKDYSDFFPKNVRLVKVNELPFGSPGIKKTFWEQYSLVRTFKKLEVDIGLFPYPCNPWRKVKFLTAVIVHDAIPWKIEQYNKGFFSKKYNLQSKSALKLADLVFTVSKYSKRDIEKYCGISGEEIKVIYNDAGDVYKKPANKGFQKKVLDKLKLVSREYFIYVGGYDERKNVTQLLEEYELFKKKNKGIKLLLVGEKIFNNDLYKSFDKAKKDKDIVFSGNISEEELSVLYHNAIALVHLSKEEGFNLPILEASNQGCPVILSDIDVNLEIAGKGAIFVDLDKKSDAGLKMTTLLDESEWERAHEYSEWISAQYLWERSALRYMDIMIKKLNK